MVWTQCGGCQTPEGQFAAQLFSLDFVVPLSKPIERHEDMFPLHAHSMFLGMFDSCLSYFIRGVIFSLARVPLLILKVVRLRPHSDIF
jgi:hypothetical protein